MEFMKQKWSSGLVVGLLFTALIAGCAKGDKGSISTSVSEPSAATFQPKGTIQGKIRDAVTLEPIVNAVVSIGLAVDVTDAQGQYILANVPATSDALNNTVSGNYDITVDLRSATSPINMTLAATTPRYPDFRYQDVSVEFTSLNDTECQDSNLGDINGGGAGTCANSSNHDTPVDGLVTNADVNVGKLAANIQGVVAGCSLNDGDFYTPVSGAVVNLVNNSSSNENTGSGASGRVVATTTTNAAGEFTFSNIEANRSFIIEATDSAVPPTLEDSTTVTSPSDGQTLYLRVQESTALHLCPVDNHGPTIIAVSPEPGSDLAAGATTVTFTFSEPVEQTPDTGITESGVDNLFDAIEVNFDGNKGGNLPYTLAWNATFDQLTVGITTGVSALYHVRMLNIDARFHDAAGELANMGVCPDDSEIPAGYGVGTSGGPDDCSVWFSTTGGPTPGTTTALELTNAASLDWSAGAVSGTFDWPVISGAKSYNLYCQRLQFYQDGSSQVDSDFLRVNGAPLDSSQTSYNFNNFDPGAGNFVGNGNEHSLKYDCKVRGVNSDNEEGADSNIKRAEDKVGPDFTANGTNGSPTVTVSFNEPVRESDAETLTNYVLTGTDAALTLQSAVYDTTTFVVTLTYSANITNDVGDTLTVTNVKDINANNNLTAPAGNNQDAL